MLAAALALACSASWGFSDFLGGLLGRRITVLMVLVASQTVGLIAGLAFAIALGGLPPVDDPGIVYAFGAGLVSVVGVGSLYKGLAVGAMGVVAPIAALSALLPVLLGLATGDSPAPVQLAGMAIALCGVVVTSIDIRAGHGESPRSNRVAILFAFIAALGFGAGQILLDAGADVDVYWTIGFMRIAAVGVLLLFAATLGPGVPRPGSYRGLPVGLLVLTGLLDVSAATFFAAASTHGALSVVAVLGSLYPVVTVILAAVLLHERLDRLQKVGAVATLAGVVLVGAGL